MGWTDRFRALFRLPISRPETIEQAVDDEVEFHLAMRVEELKRLGADDGEARAEATRRFGNIAEARAALTRTDRQAARRRAGIDWFSDLGRDVRFAVRELRRHRAFAALALMVLSLGIGLATSIVSLYDRLALHPLPYPDADRLAEAWLITRQGEHSMRVTFDDDARRVFVGLPGVDRIDGYRTEQVTADFPAGPDVAATRAVTPSLLTGLGARITLGRGLLAEDTVPTSPSVVVLGHRAWRERFGGREDVVGQSLRIGRRLVTIVGVLSAGFDLTAIAGGGRTELWLPLRADQVESRAGTVVLMTLAEGARAADVETALDRRFRATRDSTDDLLTSFKAALLVGNGLASNGASKTFAFLLGAVAMVLLVACANVAALLLGQAVGRFQEFGVRSALGAGRGRVVRQLATEAVLLGALGGAGGLAVTTAVLAAARWFRPASLLTIDDVRVDGTALAIAIGVSAMAVILFGLAPIWAVARAELTGALVGRTRRSLDGRGAGRLRSLLVIGQIAVTLMLLLGAGLLLKSFVRERNLPLGYQAQGLASVRLGFPARDFPAPATRSQLAAEVLERVNRIGGVAEATITGNTMEDFGVMFGEFLAEDRPIPAAQAKAIMPARWIGKDFFAVTGLPLVAGSTVSDDTTRREIVIDEATARRVWGSLDVIGRRVRLGREDAGWLTVVGVAGPVRLINAAFDNVPVIYERMTSGEESAALVVRLTDDGVLREVTRAIRAVHPAIRISSATTVLDALDGELANTRFTMAIVAWFAALALVLALVGLYGVVAFTVRQRHFEFGVRLALGAAPDRVTTMVIGEGLRRVALGILLGLVGSVGLVRVLRAQLYQMSPWDPTVFGVTAIGLAMVALAAVWFPARQASRIDPLEAVRAE